MSLSGSRPPSVLTIAGSDSGRGAGIQPDLKSFAARGPHSTAQNTRGVKLGMLANRQVINAAAVAVELLGQTGAVEGAQKA